MKKVFGLIGYPLEHSFSKSFFTRKFQQDNLAGYSYKLFPIHSIRQFPELVMQQPNLCGLNVTLPYKKDVMLYMDHLDETAQAAGAVNCIKIRQTKGDVLFKGFNTDVIGFEQSLLEVLGEARPERALVLGSGGSAAAVCCVLKKLTIGYTCVSRQPNTDCIPYSEVSPEVLASHLLVVNCTPLGMFPGIDDCPPIPYQALTPAHFCFDMVYNPAETLFLKKAKEKCETSNGLNMLQYQALASFSIWQNPKY